MPNPEFPWESFREEGEAYIAVDPLILEAIKELAWINQIDRYMQPILRLALRVAHITPEGRLIISVKLVRDLDPPEQ
jgi:hypothetical protein